MNSNLEIWLSCKHIQFEVVGILILTGSLGCLKEAENMDMILG